MSTTVQSSAKPASRSSAQGVRHARRGLGKAIDVPDTLPAQCRSPRMDHAGAYRDVPR